MSRMNPEGVEAGGRCPRPHGRGGNQPNSGSASEQGCTCSRIQKRRIQKKKLTNIRSENQDLSMGRPPRGGSGRWGRGGECRGVC